MLRDWKWAHELEEDLYDGVRFGEELFTTTQLAFALNSARLAISVLAPPASVEYPVRIMLGCREIRGRGNAVKDSSIMDVGQSLARLFAVDAELYIDLSWDSGMICQGIAYDLLALRRRRCRLPLLPLLSKRVVSVFPRDLRVLLARMVWDTRHEDYWANDREDHDTARIQDNALTHNPPMDWHYPVRKLKPLARSWVHPFWWKEGLAENPTRDLSSLKMAKDDDQMQQMDIVPPPPPPPLEPEDDNVIWMDQCGEDSE